METSGFSGDDLPAGPRGLTRFFPQGKSEKAAAALLYTIHGNNVKWNRSAAGRRLSMEAERTPAARRIPTLARCSCALGHSFGAHLLG